MILHSKVLGSSKNKIIILHGFLGSLDNWITFSKKISENNFEVHLLDQRNHGKSFHSNEFNYELMVKDLYEYISKFNINSVSIIGHSMGGKTAMLFSLIYPDLVEKLIIVDILPVSYNKSYDLIFDSLLNINLKQIKSRNEFNLHLKKYFDDDGFILFLSKNLKRSLDGSFEYKSNIKVLRKTYSNVTSSIYFHKNYRKEVLFIKGENSDYINSENLKITSKIFPYYKLNEIKNAGHWVHHENPDDFFSICIKYL